MKRAQKLGAKVVTFDADSAPDGRPFFVNQSTSDAIGRYGAKLLIEAMGPKGKVAIVSAQPTAANQNAWIAAFRDEIKKYKDIEIVDEVYGYDNEQKAFDATVALTTKYPDLTGIFAPTCPGLPAVGAGSRVRPQGRHDQGVRKLRSEYHREIHAGWHDPGILPVGSDQTRLCHLLRGKVFSRGKDSGKGRRLLYDQGRKVAG